MVAIVEIIERNTYLCDFSLFPILGYLCGLTFSGRPAIAPTSAKWLTDMDLEDIDNYSYHRNDDYNNAQTAALTDLYRQIITNLGEDPNREGLKKSPERIAKAMQFLTQGYYQDPKAILESAMFKEQYSQMVIVKDIEVFSFCEHHMLPFFGKAHVAYIPNGYITGLSKIARVVDAYSRRLQVQERLTNQIKDCIQQTLHPLGVAVVIEAQHMCMMMRGVEKQESCTTTSAFTGLFMKRNATRAEFINLIGKKLH